MSISGAVVVTIRYAARSSRIRRRNACGGSPATLRIIRSKWNREKWNLAAHSSPGRVAAPVSSSTSDRWSTKSAKVSVAMVTRRSSGMARYSRLIRIAAH